MNRENDVTLNNGVKMPSIGYGVFRMTDEKNCEEAVLKAIECGYRLIDTAAAYENEVAVGRAIKKSGVKREELFITTKLWITDTNYERAKIGFSRSLERLGLDYIDLYLIHQPYNDYYGAWHALEELYADGKIKAIGVDNFTQDRLADFLYFNKIVPAVNMVECNAYFQREDERKYMKEQHIFMQAWSPLAAGKKELFSEKILCEIAAVHKKTVAQIVLRWLIQRGIVPVVKSANPERMKENIRIYDLELTDCEMSAIATLDIGHTCFSPRTTGKAVTDFLAAAEKYDV